ncbi:MAG: MFS transporter, partial [Geminicoccaceae bacterium]
MAQATASAARGSGFWLVVAAACISTFVVSYNSAAVVTALPAIRAGLDLGGEALQWVMNIYMLACAILIAVMGRFADIFGRLCMFLAGMAVFAVGSVSSSLAGDAAAILAGRASQGIGTAAIIATSAAIISVATPEDKRAQALGIWIGTVALAGGIGPLIGGTITELISWRAIFALDIALLAAAAL